MNRNGLIFRAVPDSGNAKLYLNPAGVPELAMPNRLTFLPETENKLDTAGQSFWYPQKETPLPARADWVVNTCADADCYGAALAALDGTYDARSVPIFNHPRAVMAARRDIAGRLLHGIEGLEVPLCRRFLAQSPLSFIECFESSGFRYPVTLQPTASQNGQGRIWIEHPFDWQTAFNLGGGGRAHFMVQADPAEKQAQWQMRMIFVGRGGIAEPLMLTKSEGLADPAMQLSKPLAQGIFAAAMSRLPLDHWTLDLLVMGPNKCRLLDVAPGLPMPFEQDNQPDLKALTMRMTKHLKPRVEGLLFSPEKWRPEVQKLLSVAQLMEKYGK